MKESTANWVNPMVEAADQRDDIDVNLIYAVSHRPARPGDPEPPEILAELMESVDDMREGLGVRDWFLFGWILRYRLQWYDYPMYPDGCGPEAS